MKTFYDILKDVCILAHEEEALSFDDSSAIYSEMKSHITSTIDEVCSRFPWTFREKVYTFQTAAGQREYSLPNGFESANLIQNGVRIQDISLPLSFIAHNNLDMVMLGSGKPYRYSFYSQKLILDPVPDSVYTLQIKFLTSNFALDALGNEKKNLELTDDTTIMPDKYIKVVEWGAYSMFRQNFKPDEKYTAARNTYLQMLLDLQKQDNYGNDDLPFITIDESQNNRGALVNRFLEQQ